MPCAKASALSARPPQAPRVHSQRVRLPRTLNRRWVPTTALRADSGRPSRRVPTNSERERAIRSESWDEEFAAAEAVSVRDVAPAVDGHQCSAVAQGGPTLRDLSLRLARAGMFGGAAMTPIADLFRVSHEAMEIRIEELDLIDPGGDRPREQALASTADAHSVEVPHDADRRRIDG